MDAFEKAKLALRQHILENKEKVASDLIELRKKSEGKDIFKYVENLSGAYSISNITTSKKVLFDYSPVEVNYYNLIPELSEHQFYFPPDNKLYKNVDLDSEILSGSFFLLIL